MLFYVFVSCFIGFSLANGIPNVQDRLPQSENKNVTTSTPPTGTDTNSSAQFFDTNNVWLYVGLGVGVLLIVIVIQMICFIIYTRKVKVSSRRTIEDIIRSGSKNDDSRDRYSQKPSNMIDNLEMDVYESLTEIDKVNKKPPPPPIETLPRKPRSPAPAVEPVRPPLLRDRTNSTSSSRSFNLEKVPPKRIPAKHFNNTSSIPRSRDRMPSPREIDVGKDLKRIASRSRMPLPNEIQPDKTSTFPKRSPRPRITPQISTGDGIADNELMAKLKKRAALVETPAGHTINIPTALPPPPARVPKKPVAVPYPKPLKQHSYKNDSDASDDEWTIEPLKPINIYNI